ncbi:hypothetical protein TTHERM_00827050 (macronuclear) [Tetrahymena thermophila SB210]|uniref:Uncharacterized protein n=1 Tax=Tetrahymena thermophila (strain SB210) TaxID=312017 RepID=Q22EG4_TETTS|nr:hypothetical protein TTHERM_00827050 [Tetrahymena thermophila SB210]EAR83688.2 hypothetical protein TTHERM_00827050 [Tetrahymena thermophila SB210]|eukprot:XP_001031351.2 hypothetical protein TTHERM_00827050 [Tetrahymena thermophila SB210]
MQQNYINQNTNSVDMNEHLSTGTLEQQIKSLSYKQNNYGHSGLEVIQESERSSLDNNQHLEFNERRQILKDSVKGEFQGQSFRGMEDEGSTFEYQQQKVVQDLTMRISQLESDLIKERANNQMLRKEVEKRGGNPQAIAGSSIQNDDAIYQVESLKLQLQQKEDIINRQNLQLQMINTGQTQTQDFHQNLIEFDSKISGMEEQLVKIQLENERLNSVINEKNKIISMYSQARQEDFESMINEQISKYQGQVDKALQENESLFQEIEKLNLINQQLEENNRKLQFKQQEKTEEIRIFWKDHFQKSQQEMHQRFEKEKTELLKQIDMKNQLNVQLQQQLRVNSGFLVEKSQMQSQIDTQLILAKNMDTQLKDYQSTIERQRKELFEREKQLYNIQSHVTLVERKVVELQSINNQLNEQINKLNQIEKHANDVIEENKKLQEIALSKDHQALISKQETENERIQKENIAQKVQAEWEDILKKEKELHQIQIEKLNQEKIKLIEEISAHIAQSSVIPGLQQQITILEEDKEKLLVIVAEKAQLEEELQVLVERNTDLELKLTQLLENNKILNQNLGSRINEVNIWMQRFEKAQEENQRLNEKYQKQIQEIHKQTEDELRRGKEKQDQQMVLINNQMSKLEEQLNQFQLEKAESETQIRKECRDKVEKVREKNTELNEQVTHLQQCILELQQKHVLIQKEQKESSDLEIDKLKEEIYNQNLENQELKRQLQAYKQQEEYQEKQKQSQKQEEPIEGGQFNQTGEKLAEPNQFVLFENQQTLRQRANEEGQRSQYQVPFSHQYSYQVFDPNEQNNRAQLHHSQVTQIVPPPPHQYPINPSNSQVYQSFGNGNITQEGQQFNTSDDMHQLRIRVQQLQQENKQLLLAKVNDYNNFQEQLRSITNSAYLGKFNNTELFSKSQLYRQPPY